MTASEAPGLGAFLFAPDHCRGASARWRPRGLEFVESETLTPSQLSTTGTPAGACRLPAADALSRSYQQGLAETPRLSWRPLEFLTHWNRGSSRHREY